MKHVIQNGMKLVHVNVDYMQVFVMIKSVGIMINADMYVKNLLTKVDVINEFIWNPNLCEC